MLRVSFCSIILFVLFWFYYSSTTATATATATDSGVTALDKEDGLVMTHAQDLQDLIDDSMRVSGSKLLRRRDAHMSSEQVVVPVQGELLLPILD
jgi:hypothetical protein